MIVLGLCIGSFLAVVVDRSVHGLSFIHGRSQCMQCHTTLHSLDLVPLFSFVCLRGRCRYCHAPIPKMTIIVEITTACLFIATLNRFGHTVDCLLFLMYGCILLVVSGIDIQTLLIPDRYHVIITTLAIIRILMGSISWATAFLGALILSIPFAFIALVFNAIGWGDVKLVFCSGLLLGPFYVMVGFLISTLIGAIVALKAIISHERKPIPYAPILCSGFLISLYFGQFLVSSYCQLFL